MYSPCSPHIAEKQQGCVAKGNGDRWVGQRCELAIGLGNNHTMLPSSVNRRNELWFASFREAYDVAQVLIRNS